jgi:eukaryotic-like serine/threonine-protein kinase
MQLSTGQSLNNRYQIIRLLGTGGMGSVYYAHDPVLGRYVAIKQLMPMPDSAERMAEQMQKQFLREAQTLAALHHPNLPRVTDYFLDGDLHYLVMDYIEGQSLLDLLIANKRGFAEDLVLEWADQLLSALGYIHARNVIHRDIKPANIRRTTDGHIFLVDFGLAKPYSLNNPRTLTMFHGIGTPEYAPPEQYDPESHTDQRSDIYALGATLYHLLSGQAPVSATRRTADPESFRKLRQANANISPDVENVILRAMEIERAKRFASAADMRAALSFIRQARQVDPTRTTSLVVAASTLAEPVLVKQKRSQRGLAIIGVFALLVVGILIGFALQSTTDTANSASTGVSPTAISTTSVATSVLMPSPTASPSRTPGLTATATLTDTHMLTPTPTRAISTTATSIMATSIRATPAGQIQPTTVPATQPAVNPTPKQKVTPPGQAQPKNTPPGKNKSTKAPK